MCIYIYTYTYINRSYVTLKLLHLQVTVQNAKMSSRAFWLKKLHDVLEAGRMLRKHIDA